MSNIKTIIQLNGTIEHRNESGELHSENDIPALTKAGGSQYWYKNGLLHRDGDLPAIKFFDGTQSWHWND